MYVCIYIYQIYIHIYFHIYIYIYKWSYVIHNTQRAQISQKQDEWNLYAIMKSWKKIALLVITTVTLWQLMHHVPKCMSCHKVIVVITRRAHCFMIAYIYIYIYIDIYIYICMYIYLKYMRVLFSEGSAGIDLFIIVNNKCSFSLK